MNNNIQIGGDFSVLDSWDLETDENVAQIGGACSILLAYCDASQMAGEGSILIRRFSDSVDDVAVAVVGKDVEPDRAYRFDAVSRTWKETEPPELERLRFGRI